METKNTDFSLYINKSSLNISHSHFIETKLFNFYFIEGKVGNRNVTLSNVSLINTNDLSILLNSISFVLLNTSYLNSNTRWTFITYQGGTDYKMINFIELNCSYNYEDHMIINSDKIVLLNTTLTNISYSTVNKMFRFQRYSNLNISILNCLGLYAIFTYGYWDPNTHRFLISFETLQQSYAEIRDFSLKNVSYSYFVVFNLECTHYNFNLRLVNFDFNNNDTVYFDNFIVGFMLTNFYQIEILNTSLSFLFNPLFISMYNSFQTFIFDNVTIINCQGLNFKMIESLSSDNLVPYSSMIFKNFNIL